MRPHTLPSCHTHRTMGEANDAVYDAWFRVALGDSGGDSIKGKQAVGFFGRSGLDKPTLAKVWALADYDRGGALTASSRGGAWPAVPHSRDCSSTTPAALSIASDAACAHTRATRRCSRAPLVRRPVARSMPTRRSAVPSGKALQNASHVAAPVVCYLLDR